MRILISSATLSVSIAALVSVLWFIFEEPWAIEEPAPFSDEKVIHILKAHLNSVRAGGTFQFGSSASTGCRALATESEPNDWEVRLSPGTTDKYLITHTTSMTWTLYGGVVLSTTEGYAQASLLDRGYYPNADHLEPALREKWYSFGPFHC